MSQNQDNFIQQINRTREESSLPLFSLNPNNSSLTANYENLQSSSKNNSKSSSYNWAYRYFYSNYSGLLPLNSDVLYGAQSRVFFSSFPSDKGNLSVVDIEPNYVHLFSSFIYKNSFGFTQITPNWSGGLTLLVNSGVVKKTNFEQFQSSPITIALNSGWNQIDIYLYTTSMGETFSLNSDIGLFADDWQTPDFDIPITPNDFIVSTDTNATSKKDPNISVLRWDRGNPDTTLGYHIYRRGPFITGLESPVIDELLSSGYFLSGINGVQKKSYYYVSAVASNGETLVSSPVSIDFGPTYSGIQYGSGVSLTTPGGSLENVGYYYVIGARNDKGYKYPSTNSIFVVNTGNAVKLDWSGVDNINSYEIYRYSGSEFVDESYFTQGMASGQLIATLPYSAVTYTDTGIIKQYATGYRSLGDEIIDITGDIKYNTSLKNNAAYISWAIPTGSITGINGYNIYRTFYEGVFDKNSLAGTTSNNWFIDSGNYNTTSADLLVGKPTIYEHITSLFYGPTKYKDVGVFANQVYDYKISSFNYGFLESPATTGYRISPGDPFAPNTPSGITITSFNGFTTIGWFNGVEPDLDGTIVYRSDDGLLYNEIARTTSTTYSTFIGYSGYPYFKLANYDTSNNISELSSAYQGSGTLIADDVVLNNFNMLSTIDIDMDYYLYSGYMGGTSSPYRARLSAPVSNVGGISELYYAVSLDEAAANSIRLHRVGTDDTIFINYTLNVVPNRISGINGLVFSRNSVPTNSSRFLAAYYTGVQDGNYYMHYRMYSKGGGNTYNSLSSSSGINVGPFMSSYMDGVLTKSNTRPAPSIAIHSGNVDYATIVFVSGNTPGSSCSIGMMAVNYDGFQSGYVKYFPIHNGNVSAMAKVSAVNDSNGDTHIFIDPYAGTPLCADVLYYKTRFTPDISTPITIITSGKHSIGGIGGYLYPSGFYVKQTLENIEAICDKIDNISLMFKSNGDSSRFIQYSKIDSSGNVILTPNVLYQIPFSFDEDFSSTYNIQDDTIYTSYNLSSQPNQYKRLVYNYIEGAYRRRHEFERFNMSSMYQILQSISK